MNSNEIEFIKRVGRSSVTVESTRYTYDHEVGLLSSNPEKEGLIEANNGKWCITVKGVVFLEELPPSVNMKKFGKYQAQVAKRLRTTPVANGDMWFLSVIVQYDGEATCNKVSAQLGVSVSNAQDRAKSLRAKGYVTVTKRSFKQGGSTPQKIALTTKGKDMLSYLLEGTPLPEGKD